MFVWIVMIVEMVRIVKIVKIVWIVEMVNSLRRWRSASGFALRASDFALRATPGQDDGTRPPDKPPDKPKSIKIFSVPPALADITSAVFACSAVKKSYIHRGERREKRGFCCCCKMKYRQPAAKISIGMDSILISFFRQD